MGYQVSPKMNEMVRVNTRISKKLNDWLDQESVETGVPKSTLIYLALDNYVTQKKAMDAMQDMQLVLAKLEVLEKTAGLENLKNLELIDAATEE